MSDVGVSDTLALLLFLTPIMLSFLGFIPGFYLSLSYLVNTKRDIFLIFSIAILVGILFSFIGFYLMLYFILSLDNNHSYVAEILIDFIIIIELIFVVVHSKKSKLTEKVKKKLRK